MYRKIDDQLTGFTFPTLSEEEGIDKVLRTENMFFAILFCSLSFILSSIIAVICIVLYNNMLAFCLSMIVGILLCFGIIWKYYTLYTLGNSDYTVINCSCKETRIRYLKLRDKYGHKRRPPIAEVKVITEDWQICSDWFEVNSIKDICKGDKMLLVKFPNNRYRVFSNSMLGNIL